MASEGEKKSGEEQLVDCRRTGQKYDVVEHGRCPYCYGKDSDVKTGKHGEFCEFDPKKDPIHFGFPGNSTRDERG